MPARAITNIFKRSCECSAMHEVSIKLTTLRLTGECVPVLEFPNPEEYSRLQGDTLEKLKGLVQLFRLLLAIGAEDA